jgi:hypothetical protein
MIKVEHCRCKLFKDGEVIDSNVVCHINLEIGSKFTVILGGTGEIETSKPLQATIDDIVGKTQYRLLFDKPLGKDILGKDILGHEIVLIPISFTDIDLKSRTRAAFKVITYTERKDS